MIRRRDRGAGTAGSGGAAWIDVVAPTSDEMAGLAREYHLHALAIEDCLHRDQRPKLEEYPGHLFLVLHVFDAPAGSPLAVGWHEVHLFLTERAVISVHEEPVASLDQLFVREAPVELALERGPDALLHALADALMDANFPIVEGINEVLDHCEEAEVDGAVAIAVDRRTLFRARKALGIMRRTLSPARDAFAALARRGDPRVSERAALYFRDVYDHVVRLTESIDAAREHAVGLMDLHVSAAAYETGEIVRRLTILSAVFLPLGFIVGFFGQNFEALPFERPWLFGTMLALLVSVPAAMFGWFAREGWLWRSRAKVHRGERGTSDLQRRIRRS